MNKKVIELIKQHCQVEQATFVETLQSLWSGYGSIDRYRLSDADVDSIIVKHVRLNDSQQHPRGWNTNLSHQRKLQSYQIETIWYREYANICNTDCRIPECLAVAHLDDEVVILLEDLDSSGFPARLNHVKETQLLACLDWLANFHACFMQKKPTGLWPSGTYWHLQTRPDELQAMSDEQLKSAASAIDQRLTDIEYLSFVHGDAKLANFCFSVDGTQVAAVDFQYVGGGCGMKDVAYFLGSALSESDCEKFEDDLLDYYFASLKAALLKQQPDIDAEAVENCWRPLYAMAWTDFFRFLQGWSPGHWKIHDYSRRLAQQVLTYLE